MEIAIWLLKFQDHPAMLLRNIDISRRDINTISMPPLNADRQTNIIIIIMMMMMMMMTIIIIIIIIMITMIMIMIIIDI